MALLGVRPAVEGAGCSAREGEFQFMICVGIAGGVPLTALDIGTPYNGLGETWIGDCGLRSEGCGSYQVRGCSVNREVDNS